MSHKPNTFLIVLSFIAIYVIWGSTYLFNKIAVTEIAPLYLASIRFTGAGLFIFIIAKLMGLSLKITKRQFINTTIAGFLFLVYGNGVFVWCLRYVDSGFAALEASTQPLIVLILMRILYGKRIEFTSLIGVVLGFIGMYFLVGQKEFLDNKESLWAIIVILTCVVSWGYGSIFVGTVEVPKNYFISTAYQMVIGGALLLMFSAFLGESWKSPMEWRTDTSWSMVLLIVFGGVAAFTAFNYLLKHVSAEKVATSAYINPIIAVFLGWYILNEKITDQTIIAAVILLTAVYFINTKREFKSRFNPRI
jgi:drug/metabolite transporter (DMT)-like permease